MSSQNFELEKLKILHSHEVQKDLIRYVGEDLRTQLLIIALFGTGLAAVFKAYDAYVDNQASAPPPADGTAASVLPFIPWAFLFGFNQFTVIYTVFDYAMIQKASAATTPWGLLGSMVAATGQKPPETGAAAVGSTLDAVSGLAWAALFATIILGEGGLGGLLDKAGGGGFGSVASLATGVPI